LNIIIFIWWILLSIGLHELWNVWMLILEVSIHLTIFKCTNIRWVLCCLKLIITLISMILIVLFILLVFNYCRSVDVLFLVELECYYFFVACYMLSWSHTFLSCKVPHFLSWYCPFTFRSRSSIHAACLSFYIRFPARRWLIIGNSAILICMLILCLRTMIELYLLANARELIWRKFLLQSH
jgi:hypothetical protein